MSKSMSSSISNALAGFWEVVVLGREADWVIKGIALSFSCGSVLTGNDGGRNRWGVGSS